MNRKSILSGKIFAIAWIFVLMATAAPIVFASNGSTASGVSSQWEAEEGGTLSDGVSGEEYKFVTKWDNSGTGDGTLFFPCGIAVDSSGNVFVTDSGIWLNQSSNNRTLKFDSNGNFITKWGSYGTGEGEFYFYDGAFTTVGIAVDNSGNVFVTDRYNNRIQKFDSNGNFITKWGSSGFGDGEFYEPAGIAVDNSGNVFVTDTFGCRIQKFDSNGNFITKWGSYGFDDGAFYEPYAIAVDNSGNVFVADTWNHRIQKFDSNGNFITKWGSYGSIWDSFGSFDDGQFYCPCGIAVDNSGNVFVADTWNDQIQKFDSNGHFITKWGVGGIGEGEFHVPTSIAVDNSGNVFVADTGNNQIQKFAPCTSNQPQTLSNGYVTPASGDTATTFNYYVTYKDPEGDAPTTKHVYIDGSTHTMTKLTGDYTSGANFTYSTTLSEEDHNYYFYFNDGHGHTKRLPTSGTFSGPIVGTTTPDIAVSPISHDFGSVNVGFTSSAKTFTVSNTGGILSIGAITLTGTDAAEFSIWNDECSGWTSAPPATCTVDVVFSPTLEGAKSANLSIPSNDLDTPLNVPLTGTAVGVNKPDLTPYVITWTPSSPGTSDNITVTWQVKNQGDTDAVDKFYTKLYVDDVEKGSWYTDSIATGKSVHASEDIGTLSAGDHMVKVVTDTTGIIDESDESNNIYSKTLTVTEINKPDLTPYVITWTPSSPGTSDNITVTWQVKNQGDTDAVAKFHTKLYVDDVEKGSWYSDGLAVGKFVYASRDIGTLSAGDHTVKVATDTTGIIDESDESNNIYSKTLTVTEINKPDLTPYVITWTPSSPGTSDNITVTWNVKNQGDTDAVAKFRTKLYVDDVEKGSWYSDGLAVGKFVYASRDIGTLSAGDHTVKVVTDTTGIIDESDESNNIYSKTLTVTEINKPDLTPYVITWTPSSPGTSDNITVTWQVKNQGDTDAVAKFHTKLYVDDVEKGSWYSDGLAVGKFVYASRDIGTLSAGDHTVKVATDTTGIIDESDESNNIYSKTLTVTEINKPDLTPYVITWTPSSPGTSDNITVTWQVKNQGDTDAVAKFHTKLYVDDVEKGSWYSDGLAVGKFVYASRDIGTLSAGDHTVKVATDTTGTIDESDESNNIYSKTLTVFTGENIFDTGKPAKPYPSMMGTHEGTIIPSSDITISKLYTYPCAGTGGHTKSIKLYENGTLKTSGAWYGYQSDWHNITLTPPVILRAGHTYVYTIVTGSYPQIIHAKSKDVTGGTITCDEFVDTNGKKYSDWIPAIKLLGRDAPTDYATPNWLHFGYDNSYTAYNPLESTINITNVAQLERKWGVGCDDPAYSSITSSPAIYNGTLYTRFKISPSYSKLHAYDARTGQMLWQFSKNNTGRTPQPVVSEDGIIFDMEGSYPTNLYAIDADTGTELWEAPIAFDLGFTETALVTVDEENNVVYLVDFGLRGEGKLFALDKQTGEIVWFKNKATDDVSFVGDYVLLNEGKIFAMVYTTNMDHMLRIDASSHDIEIIFDRPEPESYYDIKHYALCTDKLVVVFDNKYEPVKLLVAYDPDSPTIVWQKEYLEITGNIACNTTKNVIYVPTDPYLYALDVTTGEELWKYMGYGEIYNPSIANGIVYFLSDTNVYAINEDTGERLFSYPLGKKADEGAQVAICEGMLYFSGNCGTCDLYALGLPE